MGNGGKMRDCSVNTSFYSSVTVALCRTVSHRALRAPSFPGESFSLSQQCYFLQAAHFHRVGDAGIIKCWLKRIIYIFFALRRLKTEKQTKQTERVNHSHLLLQEHDTKTTGMGELMEVVAAQGWERARSRLLTCRPAPCQPSGSIRVRMTENWPGKVFL